MARFFLATVAVSLLILQWQSFAKASHFRHGNIKWAPADSHSNTIKFTFRLAFRRSYSSSYYCDQSAISNGRLIGSGDSWTANCGNPSCSSIAIADTGFHCTDYSSNEDWSMGENNFTYTFPSIDNEWVVSYTSCCWISLSRYGNGNWLVSASVNLYRRPDNGRINSSPVSRSPAIVRWQEGCPHSLRIPVEDPDGDVVKCRWASYSESSINSDSFPYGTLDEETCVLTYNRGSGTAGTYAVALTLEDFPAGTTNFSSVSPFSTVGLQFLVIISSHSGSCSNVPVFTASTPDDGECSEVQIGSAYITVIEVKLADFSKHIVEIVTSSPTGMQVTLLRYHGGVYYRNVTWYPNKYQVGQQLFCFKAVDSTNMESKWRCVTILVGLSNTPHVITGSRTPTNPISKNGPGFIWWSIQFDRVIKKPRTSSYIRLVLLPSGHTVYKVDILSQYAMINSDHTTLQFAMPNAALSMNGSYAILIDRGAVVGQGCSYEGPPTPGITNTTDWNFAADGVCPNGYYLAPPEFTNCKDVNECGSHSRSKRSNSCPGNIYAQYYNINFTSPSYPSYYSNYEYCSWTIEAPVGHYVYLYFYDFDLESGYDKLYIFDGNSTSSPQIIRATGKMAPWSIYSSGRFLLLRFTTDSSDVRTGFAAWCRATTQRHYNFSSHQESSSTSLYQSSTMSIFSTPSIHGPPYISASVSPPPPTSLRLVGGNWGGEGRVEIFHNGYWGTVCDDSWDIYDARVVCRELGYPDALSAPSNAYFGLGTGHIWLDNVHCGGLESSIVNCQHNGWGSHDCVHGEDASVICSANYSTSSPNGITPTPVMPSSASFSISFSSSECSSYTYLEDSVRSQGFYNGYYGFYQCDSSLAFGWYRFRGAAGTQMPTTCVGKNRCSSHAPGWLSAPHPSVGDGIVNATVCFHWDSSCCRWTKNIRVRNCSEFYVYELGPTPTCWLRYCGNGGANFSTSSFSSTSSAAEVSSPSSLSTHGVITPTPAITLAASSSRYLLIHECWNHSYLEDLVRGQGFYNGYSGYYQCDNNLPFGWYRFRGAAGTQMATQCVGENRCSSHGPGWLSTPHPSVADGIVSARVCFHWGSCCLWSINIRVRNCSGFYVYELKPTPSCSYRYCGNGGGNFSTSSSNGISSTTGAISPTPAITLAASSSSYMPVDECSNHVYLEDFKRGQSFYNGYNGYYRCDNNLPFGWYRFRGAAGTQMPTQCVGENRCGSHGPGWLSTPHPSVADGIASGAVCFHWGSCCLWSINIRVRNCSGFYVYELKPTQSCHYRYCGNGGASNTSSSSSVIKLTSASQIVPTSSSLMSSIRYASSSSYVLPTPTDFQLHMPADCAQICTNNPGSYSCSCVRGYQLASDGKSCIDIDECFTNNGGCSHYCYNIPGSFYCGCPAGTTMTANNLTCIEPGVTVTCDENNMTVSLEKQIFPFFEVSQLHLHYPSCGATQNSTHFLISTHLNGCGTMVNETEQTLIFWNRIRADAVVIDNVITRTHDISLPFSCSYSRRKMLSLIFKPRNIVFGHEAGYGNFTFRMDFYNSTAFETHYTEKDYPIQIALNDYLYVKYSVESSADLVIMAENCKATKDGSYHSWPQHNIIQNGCPQDSTMDYTYDPSRSYQQFKIRTFRFFNDYDTVYFHCEVLACNRYSPNSRCSRSCLNSKRRKRRDVTRDDVVHQESTNKEILTGGPIKIVEKRETGDTGQSKEAALIGGAAAAGGFGLFAAIALAVLFVKYRIARRFMNRNKVGDLYTTKEEQISRKNAYIQEDDMIEKDDAF